MALCVNDSGTWREITTLCVNDSGTWRQVTDSCVNDSGTWRCFGMTFGPDIAGASLGDNIAGGYLICKASSVGWIVAPASTEVSRSWFNLNDAITTAQASAPCGDWFVPTISQLQNPGILCRTHWDSYSSPTVYWSSTEEGGNARRLVWPNNINISSPKCFFSCIRAFRCVSY